MVVELRHTPPQQIRAPPQLVLSGWLMTLQPPAPLHTELCWQVTGVQLYGVPWQTLFTQVSFMVHGLLSVHPTGPQFSIPLQPSGIIPQFLPCAAQLVGWQHAAPRHTPPPQLAQVPPAGPQAAAVLPGAQVPLEQQPPLQGAFTLQPEVQTWFTRSHACSAAQSDGPLHPHRPVTHTCPIVEVVQSAHRLPLPPHALAALPPRQVPLLAAEQQPDTQGVCAPQVLTHWLPVHDELPFGQSASELQPQRPPPAVAWHRCPIALLVHEPHVAPLAPQSFTPVPGSQVPFRQQPPLHGWDPSHTLPHLPLAPQAVPAGQSAALAQPHAPPTHRLPFAEPLQFTHRPERPHAVAALPAAHTPLPQQPPLHGWVPPLQVVVH
jgi:hypothetical protein